MCQGNISSVLRQNNNNNYGSRFNYPTRIQNPQANAHLGTVYGFRKFIAEFKLHTAMNSYDTTRNSNDIQESGISPITGREIF
jgi:hypothetical protein